MSKENKEKGPAPNGWMRILGELFKTDIYKRSQGRIVRQMTCLAVWVTVALATWRIFTYLKVFAADIAEWRVFSYVKVFGDSTHLALIYTVPTIVLFAGIWIGYRLVNLPTFADFLIAVEAEMNKVSWPSRLELVRSSMVVIILMFGLTMVLFAYDLILTWLLRDVLGITV